MADGLDELFKGRRLGEATIAGIRRLDLHAKDLVDLSPQDLSALCQAIGASAGDVFKIKASVGVARYRAVTGIHGFGAASQGLNARLYICERKETMAKLESLVWKERAVVVRAPPQSGKTSLLQLLEMRCKSTYTDVFCISLAGINGHDFDYMWYQHYPSIPVERLQSGAPTLLLVDEVQSGFRALNLRLWALIKAAQSGTSSLHIVLVSSFGSDECDTGEGATPVVFPASSTVAIRPEAASESSGVYIQFTDSECVELWQNWCKFCSFVPKDDNILHYVMDVSDRQPGLMTHILDWLVRRKFNDKNGPDREAFAKSELLSERFMQSLSDIRSISTFRSLCWKREYADVLAKLLNSGSAMGSVTRTELSVDELSAANKLLRKGQLVRTKTMDLMFPSALHRHYYASLSTGTLTVRQVQELGIEEFLVRVIRRMNSRRLACSKSRSSNDGTLYERQYQNEFYRAYCTLLSVPMSPDVGKLYGVAGYVDFYLAALKWAFEIARLGEHLDRFALEGRYSALVSKGVVRQYVVVNMEAGGVVYEDEPRLIQVVFSEDYTSAVIYPSGQQVFLTG